MNYILAASKLPRIGNIQIHTPLLEGRRTRRIGISYLRRCLISLAFLCTVLSPTGTAIGGICPPTPGGLSLPILDLDPPPAPGEPEMSIKGLFEFIQVNDIGTISEMLSVLPEHYNKNYALVETTGTPGLASLEFPRLVLFGSDARFMANVATDPNDPDYERLDMMFMDKNSGVWEFAQLDLTTSPPKLNANPESCTQCHGSPPRPLWGTYLDWPGVIGDDSRPGLQAETLTADHARRFNELKAGRGNPERFHTLKYANRYTPGRAQKLPDHDYGFALTVSNGEIGFSHSESVYLRLKNRPQNHFRVLREELLLLRYYKNMLTTAERDQIKGLIANLGGQGDDVDDLLAVLGIDADHEFSLHRLPSESPDQGWNAGSGRIPNMVDFLVLVDLLESDPELEQRLDSVPSGSGIFGIWSCQGLAQSVLDVVKFKHTQGWKSKGSARQTLFEEFYGLDITRIRQPIFDQAGEVIFPYLRARISSVEDLDGPLVTTIGSKP